MLSDVLCLDEADVICLILSFFELSGLDASAATLEHESGIRDANIPGAALRLREMVQKARWKDAMECVKSLPLTESDIKLCLFEIMKQKYVELICIYQELKNELVEDLGNAIAVCFSELSAYCMDVHEYENLRKLASLNTLSEDPVYRNWSPFSSRNECFRRVWDIVKNPLLSNEKSCDSHGERHIPPGRLLFLLVKGMLYESCEEYCKQKAQKKTNKEIAFSFGSLTKGPLHNSSGCKEGLWNSAFEGEKHNDHKGGSVGELPVDQTNENLNDGVSELKYDLSATGCSNDMLDYSLYSWLQTVPWVSIAKNFVHRPLNVEIKKLVKPKNRDGWTEKILEGMNQQSDFSFQDVQEKFWNEKISSNLIVDAPEILKRAEEVVNRWEAKKRQRRGKNISELEYYKFDNDIQYVALNLNEDFTDKSQKKKKMKTLKRRSIYTNQNSRNNVSGRRNKEECTDEINEEEKVSVYSSVKNRNIQLKSETDSLFTRDKEKNTQEINLLVDAEYFENECATDEGFLLENEVTGHTIIGISNEEFVKLEMNSCDLISNGNNNDAKGNFTINNFSSNNAENCQKQDASKTVILKEVKEHLRDNSKDCVNTSMLISPQNEEMVTEFDECHSKDAPSNSILVSSNEMQVQEDTKKFSESECTSDRDLIHKNFLQRKKYVMELLKSKQQLRDNLLRIITGETNKDEENEKNSGKKFEVATRMEQRR